MSERNQSRQRKTTQALVEHGTSTLKAPEIEPRHHKGVQYITGNELGENLLTAESHSMWFGLFPYSVTSCPRYRH